LPDGTASGKLSSLVSTNKPAPGSGPDVRSAAFAAQVRNNRMPSTADPHSLASAIVDNLFYRLGRLPENATATEWYNALAGTVRDRVVHHFVETARVLTLRNSKIVCYLSAEFLLGPQLIQNLINLDMHDEFRQAIALLGLAFDEIVDQEEEPGLGNGGLGRLAACFLESMSTLEIPAIGYGLRYEFGIFDQEIRDGWQREITDKWLRLGNPWEIAVPEISYLVKFGGRTQAYHDADGRYRVRWIPDRVVNGTPYDIAGIGYRVKTTSFLRLWKAEAAEAFDFAAFNEGDYYRAVEKKVESENLTKILYPNDRLSQGKQLRLEQQYFLVSCTLQDMLRLHLRARDPLDQFHEHFAAQLNDTHPAIAVPELMRLLVDEHLVDWDTAWRVTTSTFGYTNHTLLAEALEQWPLPLFGSVLPRHLEIVFEINRRFLDEVRLRYPHDDERVRRMSLIDEHGQKAVRMAHLASVGSHAINGVAVLHTELLKNGVLRDFHDLHPERFHNVTNGVTPRRWMLECNPALARLITEVIGDRWIRDAEQELPRLEPFADDPAFRESWQQIKRANKVQLAAAIEKQSGIRIDPDSLFDIHVKRIHEYKRQHLNVLHVITRYDSYIECQDRVDEAFTNRELWARKSILTVARMGRFSSDRAIREYARTIWHVDPLPSPSDAGGS
jgi:glycogen phosphorylase